MRVQKVGDVCYLVDAGTGKPIYSFTAEGGKATVSIIAPLSSEAIGHARRRALTMAAHNTLLKSADLLMDSLETRTSDLHAFISAWTAMEIFIKTTFKAVYDRQWLEILANVAPQSANSYLDRLKEGMSGKDSIADKFTVIAAILEVNENSRERHSAVQTYKSRT